MRRALPLAIVAALALPASAAAFAPNDRLAPRQWHLAAVRAFDFWPVRPALRRVRVAVIDSGIDGRHPDLYQRVDAAESFVDEGPLVDTEGHGTFVAGLIAAETDNGEGIAGLGLSARLMIAKVVRADGSIDPFAEARAIRWAVDRGADVINLSLGGTRDPSNQGRDTYSPLEQRAIEYAVRRGVVVVAAVGNGEFPDVPWSYASYPAALPHVVGVSAYAKGGSVPDFSNRDAVYNDISAPGDEIVSTLPRALTAKNATCVEQGYSVCGPRLFRRGAGTSFAAPQVSAAAALLLGVRPGLHANQVRWLIERAASDATPADGCSGCRAGRDSLTGWGRLDVAAALKALQGPIPRADRLEPNDEAGVRSRRLFGRGPRVQASLDYWDDPNDVYRFRLRAGERVSITLRARPGLDSTLNLWRPGTRAVEGPRMRLRLRAARSARPGAPVERISYRARVAGWYYVHARLARAGAGPYTLTVAKS